MYIQIAKYIKLSYNKLSLLSYSTLSYLTKIKKIILLMLVAVALK